MPLAHNQFASKLNELEAGYTQMISRIQSCHKGSLEDIAQAKKSIMDECLAQETELEEIISSGRSTALTELSAMQLRYFREIRSLSENKIPQYLDAMSVPSNNSRAEAMALYAEFAIDNALQSMRYALHAVFSAVELQLKEEATGSV